MYENIDIIECFFKSAGADLAGRLFVPQKADFPVPLFVLISGIGGRKEWFEPLFPQEICQKNFALFTFDLRGHYPSTGRMDANIGYDLPSAIEYLKERDEIDSSKIIIGGQCLGALLCNKFVADNTKDLNIIGAVNISIFLPYPVDGFFSKRTSDLVMKQIERSKTHYADIDKNSFFNGFGKNLNALGDAEQVAPRPYLLIHYKDDPISEFYWVKIFFDKLHNPNKKEYFFKSNHETWISGLKHAISYDDPKVPDVVGKWIDKNFQLSKRRTICISAK